MGLLLAALAVIVRPTNALIWMYICLRDVAILPSNGERANFIVTEIVPVGITALLVSAIIDRISCSAWTLVQFNFLTFNLLSGLDALYSASVALYLSQGIPAVVALKLPLVLLALSMLFQETRRLRVSIGR